MVSTTRRNPPCLLSVPPEEMTRQWASRRVVGSRGDRRGCMMLAVHIAGSPPLSQIPIYHRRVQIADTEPVRSQPSIQVRDEAHVLLGRAARITQPRKLFGEPRDMPPGRAAHERAQQEHDDRSPLHDG
jgi:hypothetical protein